MALFGRMGGLGGLEGAEWLRWLREIRASRCSTGCAGPCQDLFRQFWSMLVTVEVEVGRFERFSEMGCAKAFAMTCGPPRP